MKPTLRRGLVLLLALVFVMPLVVFAVWPSMFGLASVVASAVTPRGPAGEFAVVAGVSLIVGWIGLVTLIWLSCHFFVHPHRPRRTTRAWLGLVSGSMASVVLAIFFNNAWLLLPLASASVFGAILIAAKPSYSA